MASATAPARGPSASDEPLVMVCDELADEQLLEAERRLVGLLVGGAALAHLARQRAVGDGREPGDPAHRFTPLAISHIWSAVWIALDVSW